MSKKQKPMPNNPSNIKIIQKNKKGFFNYEVLDRYECGIVLLGPEVKSIRANNVQFADSFARVSTNTNAITLHNLHISPYKYYQGEGLDPVRVRKLLCKHEELKKIKRSVEEKGHTLVPLALYLKNNLIKVELGICRGKKLHDKRESTKRKDIERDTLREIKSSLR